MYLCCLCVCRKYYYVGICVLFFFFAALFYSYSRHLFYVIIIIIFLHFHHLFSKKLSLSLYLSLFFRFCCIHCDRRYCYIYVTWKESSTFYEQNTFSKKIKIYKAYLNYKNRKGMFNLMYYIHLYFIFKLLNR